MLPLAQVQGLDNVAAVTVLGTAGMGLTVAVVLAKLLLLPAAPGRHTCLVRTGARRRAASCGLLCVLCCCCASCAVPRRWRAPARGIARGAFRSAGVAQRMQSSFLVESR